MRHQDMFLFLTAMMALMYAVLGVVTFANNIYLLDIPFWTSLIEIGYGTALATGSLIFIDYKRRSIEPMSNRGIAIVSTVTMATSLWWGAIYHGYNYFATDMSSMWSGYRFIGTLLMYGGTLLLVIPWLYNRCSGPETPSVVRDYVSYVSRQVEDEQRRQQPEEDEQRRLYQKVYNEV